MKGEYVDISKLRLMTVEECAGHTIDYAMGWKACIEWIVISRNCWKCPFCQELTNEGKNFCPNCGAKMGGEEP